MVNYIHHWFNPAPQAAQQGQSHSSPFVETVVAAALGALALLTANAFDRTNPGLALLLRCAAGGIGLIWLFKRCSPTNGRHYQPAPVIYSPPVQTQTTYSSYSHQPRQTYTAPVVQPMPLPTYSHPPQQARTTYSHVPLAQTPVSFPAVQRAPAQPDPRPMYQAPVTRTVVPPTQPAFTPAPASQPSLSFPAVQRAPAQPDPRPMHQAPVARAFVPSTQPAFAPVPASQPSMSFPAVQRAPAQPSSPPMRQAPATRV